MTHYNTKFFQVILFPWKFYINTEGFPQDGDYKKAVVRWGIGIGFIEIRRWGWIRTERNMTTSNEMSG